MHPPGKPVGRSASGPLEPVQIDEVDPDRSSSFLHQKVLYVDVRMPCALGSELPEDYSREFQRPHLQGRVGATRVPEEDPAQVGGVGDVAGHQVRPVDRTRGIDGGRNDLGRGDPDAPQALAGESFSEWPRKAESQVAITEHWGDRPTSNVVADGPARVGRRDDEHRSAAVQVGFSRRLTSSCGMEGPAPSQSLLDPRERSRTNPDPDRAMSQLFESRREPGSVGDHRIGTVSWSRSRSGRVRVPCVEEPAAAAPAGTRGT